MLLVDYMAGASDDEKAVANNVSSFDQNQLSPKKLYDVRLIEF